ncbi:MAG: hypothetical protein AB7J30_20385, partial [Hyphomicrobium sp.]|uniref:hypothetical protein n=1 Tax=Hyphomicrobium sp. TaxID=82 RepID=UPI003D0BD7CE
MRIRLLTTAAAIALFATMTAPGLAMAAGETPSSISTSASSSSISGSAGTMGSSGTLGASSNVSGSTVMPTPGMPGTVSTPISGPVGSNAEPGRYIGAPYETSMGGTEHFRRTTRGDLQASNNQSRYDELVQTIRETAGDTRGMADRNTAGPLPQSPFA